jgi:hypothetical protein
MIRHVSMCGLELFFCPTTRSRQAANRSATEKNSPSYIEPKGLLSCSQDPTTGPFLDQLKSQKTLMQKYMKDISLNFIQKSFLYT